MSEYNDIRNEAKNQSAAIVDKAAHAGYDIGYHDGYEKGLNDAWECAQKVRHMTFADRVGIFGTESVTDIFNRYSASEAIAKIKEHEEKKKADEEIKVGDEVMVDERCMIVLGVDSGEWKQLWCPSSGLVYDNIYTAEMTKTGRHFDIQNLLNQMNEGVK